jgi:hypothetical protein
MTLTEVLRMESYARYIDDRERGNDANDSAYPVQLEVGDLVKLTTLIRLTHKAERKFALGWSAPRIVVSRAVNSDILANLNGTVKRSFHGNHLRGFVVTGTPGSRAGDIIGEWMLVEKTGLS